MNLNFRRTALLVGICSAVSLTYTPQLFAASVDAIDAVQQAKKITGTVTDAMGPVIGANVLEKGTTNGVITDIDGNFTLNVQPGATIVVSFIGYQPQEIVVGNQTSFKIQLKEDTELLDEVVVVGYGVQKKKLVTGATVEVKGEDIAKLNTTQALGALQSQSPGVNIQAVSGQPGDGFKINIRGAGTNGNTAPVYVIDGVAGGDINALNPADIERIDVLKDAASCAIYGSSGANGVILITTKQGKVGKVSVSYDGNIGWANIYKMPDMLNAKEYMAVMDQVAYNNGGQPYDWSKFVDADLLTAYQNGTNPGTDWVKEFRNKNAVVTNHALNVTGGSEFSKFSTGIGYQYQDGAFGGPVKTDYRRFTFRINSEHVIYRKGDVDVIKFGENIYYQHKQNQGVQLGNQYSNDLSNALRAIPLIPVYNENGDFFMYDDLKNFGTSANGILDYTAYASNPMAHMVWGQGGFLGEIGSVDFAGGNVVHISSGVSALVFSIILGRRKGYENTAYRVHNIPCSTRCIHPLVWVVRFQCRKCPRRKWSCSTCIHDNGNCQCQRNALMDDNRCYKGRKAYSGRCINRSCSWSCGYNTWCRICTDLVIIHHRCTCQPDLLLYNLIPEG